MTFDFRLSTSVFAVAALLLSSCQTPINPLDSSLEIKPGIPEQTPYWNTHARRFIFKPSFELLDTLDATGYAASLAVEGAASSHSVKDVDLSAWFDGLWGDLAFGRYTVTVSRTSDDSAIGSRTFIKSPPFEGYTGEAVYPYHESAVRSLEALLRDARAQTWLETGAPNAEYPLWVHPTKIIGGLVRGMVLLATISEEDTVRAEASAIARIAGETLLAMREPPGSPLENWPPTFWDGVPRGEHPVRMDEMMTVVPAEGAQAFLSLFDLTGDSTYFKAVGAIFDGYRRLQRDDGSWYLLLSLETGDPRKQNSLVPTRVIRVIDRLRRQYGVTDYDDIRERALDWCLENPVINFAWEAQFEDTAPKPLYRNMSHREAAEFALVLLDDPTSGDDRIELALELLRYVEDQFIVWDRSDPVVWTPFFRKGTRFDSYDPGTGKNWFVPGVLEQYAFYTPIAGASGTLIEAFLAVWRRTGNPEYHARAVALANSITRGQEHHGGGEIPTHLRRVLPESNWINVGVNAASDLYRHADELSRTP